MHVYVWRTTFSIGCCSSNNVCMILTHIQAFSFNYSHIGSGSGPAAASYTQQPVKDVPTDDQWAPHGGILDTSQWIFPHIHFFLYPIKLLLPSINGSASFAPRIPSLVAVDPQMTEMQSITGDSVELQRSGSGMWENRTRLPPALHQNVNIWASFYPWRGFFLSWVKKKKMEAPFQKQICHERTCPASFMCLIRNIPSWLPMYKSQRYHRVHLGWDSPSKVIGTMYNGLVIYENC